VEPGMANRCGAPVRRPRLVFLGEPTAADLWRLPRCGMIWPPG
jgi:hypothetical protein